MSEIAREHLKLTRRYFLRLGAAAACALSGLPLCALNDDVAARESLSAAIAKLEYLTMSETFGTVERGRESRGP